MARRQLPLFPSQPTTPAEISKLTPLGATLEHFERSLQKEGKSQHTIKAFMGDMLLLAEYARLETPVGQYTTTGLNDYLDWIEHGRGIPCSRKTYARRVTTLKVYFKWLRALGAIPHDPALAILQRSGPAPLSNVLSPDEVRAVLYATRQMKRGEERDHRPELILRLLLETGIKKSETERLLLTDIDRLNPVQPQLVIRHSAQNVYKERRIGFSPELLAVCDAYIRQYMPQDHLFTCTTRNLEYILTDIGEIAEIPFKLSFEVLRWTSAVLDYRNGQEEDFIREKLGLSKTSWYETYHKIKQLAQRQIEAEQA